MKGQVVGVNGNRVTVRIPSGITLCKINSEHTTAVGDTVSGNLDALGPEPLVNETQGQKLKAFLAGWGCSQKKADRFLHPE